MQKLPYTSDTNRYPYNPNNNPNFQKVSKRNKRSLILKISIVIFVIVVIVSEPLNII